MSVLRACEVSVASRVFFVCALWCGLSAVSPGHASAQSVEPDGKLHALLLNGGGNPKVNYLSHFHHLEDMMEVLLARGVPADQITVFSADGEASAPDLASKASLDMPEHSWLVMDSRLGGSLRASTETVNSTWEGVKLRPATYDALRRWFRAQREVLKPGDTLLIFVTDHGTKGKDDLNNGHIVLWDEKMSVVDFRALLSALTPKVRVVSVMSQCFSGTFANAIYPLGESVPEGNACGFFATRNDRYAYGCYPEGRGKDQIGHAFQFIDGLRRQGSLLDAHDQVSISDDAPDVPLRTSDLFLARRLKEEAQARKTSVDELADELLSIAWRSPERFARQSVRLDQMAAAYEMHSPRTLSSVSGSLRRTKAFMKRADAIEKLWDRAYEDLVRANFEAFMASDAGAPWVSRLESAKLRELKAGGKEQVLRRLVPEVHRFARERGRAWQRLTASREQRVEVTELAYRMDIREAVLLRMRHVLMRVAGEVLLEQPAVSMASAEQARSKEALDALNACEASAFGRAPGARGRAHSARELGSLAAERRLLLDNLPSRLGVGYELADAGLRQREGLPAGAVKVTRVQAGSPAERAGLEVDDVVLGSPGEPFEFKDHIRAWVMTSTVGRPVKVEVWRGGVRRFVSLTLAPVDAKLPEDIAPGAEVGQPAPKVPAEVLGGATLPEGRRLLLFWSSWCTLCGDALEHALGWGEARGVPVVLVVDQDEAQVAALELGAISRTAASGHQPVARLADPSREAFQAFGVHTAPTFVLIDARGRVERRSVGHVRGFKQTLPQ